MAEVAALKVSDIDSECMLLRAERGKGGRYRNAMLPADLLTLLREWWKAGRHQGVMHRTGWLFPGQQHPPLRAACRFIVQGKSRTRPRIAGRCATAR